jgi:aspartyl-tRNA(Asn)/glutamyl-tRNA(Gln) amidotransferase subunit A
VTSVRHPRQPAGRDPRVGDSIFVVEMPARWGGLLYRDHVPDRDDVCVERLREAGAVIIGNTTTPEFALLGRTHRRLSGITRNTWVTRPTPEGSSGRTIASVAIEVMALALGIDIGCSTRLSSALTASVARGLPRSDSSARRARRGN